MHVTVAIGVGLVLALSSAGAQSVARGAREHAVKDPPRNAWAGVYSAAQAERGGEVYRRACGYCHRDNLLGDYGPPLVGVDFTYPWDGRTLGDLYETIASTMPPESAVDRIPVSRRDYLNIVAFILRANGLPPGTSELPLDTAQLRQIVFTRERPQR
jgi:hypothetical protein